MSNGTDSNPWHAGAPEGASGAAGLRTETTGDGSMEDMQSLMDAAESGGFQTLRRRQTAKGVVVSIGDDAVLVDVGTKSEGIIPRAELAEEGEEFPTLRYGQEILVQVLEPESPQGPILSLRRAQREQAWVDLEALAQSGDVIQATIVDHNRGGALAEFKGVRGFVPLSQLVSLPPSQAGQGEEDDTQARLSQLHGHRLSFKVLEANRSDNRLILSERAAEQERRDLMRAEVLADIQVGQIRKGTVRNVTNFGAFVDLGGADGLIHVSEMSYDRAQDPKSILRAGQEVDVYVLEVRPEDQRIALSLKRAGSDPWDTAAERLRPGQTVAVIIKRLAKFGAFAQVEPGLEGLIHITELAEVPPRDPGQVVHEGQELQVKVIHVDARGRRLGLSLRQMQPAETEMTADQWHREQEEAHGPSSSGFEALSSLVDTLPEALPAEPETAGASETGEPIAAVPEGEPEEPVKPKRSRAKTAATKDDEVAAEPKASKPQARKRAKGDDSEATEPAEPSPEAELGTEIAIAHAEEASIPENIEREAESEGPAPESNDIAPPAVDTAGEGDETTTEKGTATAEMQEDGGLHDATSDDVPEAIDAVSEPV